MKAQIIPFGVAIKASIFFHIHIASYTHFNTLSLIQSPKNSGHPEEKSLLRCLTLEKSFPLSKAMFLGNAPWKASPLRSFSLLWVVVTSKKRELTPMPFQWPYPHGHRLSYPTCFNEKFTKSYLILGFSLKYIPHRMHVNTHTTCHTYSSNQITLQLEDR